MLFPAGHPRSHNFWVITDTLLIVLTSPQFLFLIEKSDTPKPEPLTGHELASKLSYFLWNTMPDPHLQELGAAGR